MNNIFWMSMDTLIIRVSCKINAKPSGITLILKGFTLTLQETWSIHDSMNIPKIEFIS